MQDKNNQRSIYYVNESHRTNRENFETFMSYVATSEVKGGISKQEREAIFRDHVGKMSVPEMKAEMVSYHEKVINAGMFFKKQDALEETLLKMHYIEVKNVVSVEYAEAMKNDKNFRNNHIKITAKDLLSGSKLYAYVASAAELKNLREANIDLNKELVKTKAQTTDLSTKLEKVNRALTNLVTNLKQKLGFSEEKINDLINTSPAIEKKTEMSKGKSTGNNKGFDLNI